MFKTAVLGPIATRGVSVVQQCVECARARRLNRPEDCDGFGPGCLGYSGREAAAAPEDLKFRFILRRELA